MFLRKLRLLLSPGEQAAGTGIVLTGLLLLLPSPPFAVRFVLGVAALAAVPVTYALAKRGPHWPYH